LIVGGDALSQVWLFIVAPLIGGVLAAGVYLALVAERTDSGVAGQVEPSDLPAG
jgi:aquaporin Z